MSRLMSRWSSSIVIAITLLLGTLSGTPAQADDLNLCKPSAQSPVLISLPADEAPHVVHDEWRSEEHTSELQSRPHLVCRLLLEKKKSTKLDSSYVLTVNC